MEREANDSSQNIQYNQSPARPGNGQNKEIGEIAIHGATSQTDHFRFKITSSLFLIRSTAGILLVINKFTLGLIPEEEELLDNRRMRERRASQSRGVFNRLRDPANYSRFETTNRLRDILNNRSNLYTQMRTSNYEIFPGTDGSTLYDHDLCFNEFTESSMQQYGSWLFKTFKKLLNKKIMKITDLNEKLIKNIVDIYISNLELEKVQTKSLFKDTKLLISCLPSVKKINRFISKENINLEKHKSNIYFIKICLDIHENYLKTFDFPLFSKYKNSFLNTAIEFYSKLTDTSLRYINNELDKHMLVKGTY